MDDDTEKILQEAVRIMWDADYAQADALLAPHADKHPAVATMYSQSMWIRVRSLFFLLAPLSTYCFYAQALISETADDSKDAFDRMDRVLLTELHEN
jgi:hypothetical protein